MEDYFKHDNIPHDTSNMVVKAVSLNFRRTFQPDLFRYQPSRDLIIPHVLSLLICDRRESRRPPDHTLTTSDGDKISSILRSLTTDKSINRSRSHTSSSLDLPALQILSKSSPPACGIILVLTCQNLLNERLGTNDR